MISGWWIKILESTYEWICHRAGFHSLVPDFSESDFVLLWYETLHSEVAWTEENAGKSEFTLFTAWLITLHKVFWCQNTTKIHIKKQAKLGQSFHLVYVPSEWGKVFLA